MIHLMAGIAFNVQSTTIRNAGIRRTARNGRRMRRRRSERNAVSVPASTPDTSKTSDEIEVATMMKSSLLAV